MRIVVNGWFAGQLAAGSGQYLAGLLAWLPAASSPRGCDDDQRAAVASHEFILVTPGANGDISGAGEPWRVITAPPGRGRLTGQVAKLWFEQVSFPLACWRLRADLALVPYWGAPWWQPCPLLVTVHDIIPRLLPLYRGGPLQRAYTRLVSLTARRAAAVLTDSEASRRDIVAHLRIPAMRVHAIHLAVDPRFGPVTDAAELQRVRTRYGLPAGPFLLYLGGFDARKNLPRLLAAYSRLVTPDPAARSITGSASIPRLVIAGKLPAGDSPFAPDPRPLAERLGLAAAVHFTGWVEEADKPALYSLATAALFVSEYEGFGLPVLEAQACGCPVISSL